MTSRLAARVVRAQDFGWIGPPDQSLGPGAVKSGEKMPPGRPTRVSAKLRKFLPQIDRALPSHRSRDYNRAIRRTFKIWTPGSVERLAGRAQVALTVLREAFELSHVPAGGDHAWGQYVDEHHRSSQWGLYGTSAAIQALALIARRSRSDQRPSNDPLVGDALPLLPSDLNAPPAALQPKVAQGDFNNLLKLAYVAEAFNPDELQVGAGGQAPIVDELLNRADPDGWWKTSTAPGHTPAQQKFFPTAYLLLALQRYDSARDHLRYQEARKRVAEEVTRSDHLSPTALVLAGLALDLPGEAVGARPQVIGEALDVCEQRALDWAAKQKPVNLDRPAFVGFALGARNSYNFFQPEILAALFLLRRGDPARGRRFVLNVIEALVENISTHRGFENEDRMKLTVSQLWAARLLNEFLEVHRRPGSRAVLLPPQDLRLALGDRRSRLIALVLLIAVGIVLYGLTTSKFLVGVLIGVAALIFVLVNVLLTPRDPTPP